MKAALLTGQHPDTYEQGDIRAARRVITLHNLETFYAHPNNQMSDEEIAHEKITRALHERIYGQLGG